MDIDLRTACILCLNVHKKDKTTMNDFADFNSSEIAKNFKGGDVFYFSDAISANGIRHTEAMIKKIIKDKNISVVFFAPNGDSYELSIEFFSGLREMGVKNVLWVLDDEMIFDVLTKYYAQVFDAAITCDYYATFAYRKLGIPSLYYFSSYSKNDFPSLNNRFKDIDVSFVGDCTKANMLEYINHLRKNGIGISVFGEGSENGFIRKDDLSLILSRSKINLNFTRLNTPTASAWFLRDNTLTAVMRQNKGRPMEIAMAGSFCLSEYSSSLPVTFEIGKEMDVFYDKEDLLAKVGYYLENEDIRNQMAGNAHRKAVTLYDVDVFMPELLKELCNVLNSQSYVQMDLTIYKDTVFKKNHITRLTILMFYQFLKLRFKPALETFTNLFQYGLSVFFVSFLRGIRIAFLKVSSKFSRGIK